MKKATFLILFFGSIQAGFSQPDTVRVGTYVMSVHDINFHDQEYTSRLWLWFIYNNKKFDFGKQLDITNAKSIDNTQQLEDSLEGKRWSMLKMKCTMKENWSVSDFPFDRQHLKIQIENTLFDKSQLIFKPDRAGSKFDSDETLAGWSIKNFQVSVTDNFYETGFGDNRKGHTNQTFSAFLIEMDIDRNAWGLFLKIFIGMYIAFLISMVSFAPHPEELEPRFGLPVGGLFAAVGNKYIIDSVLPESASFTLVDSLHAITFFTIFTILVVSAICLKIHDRGREELAIKFNRWGARVIALAYTLVNVVLVVLAIAE
ncbi:MAG: hypothetical protein JST43_06380 [Bacteroidetes bacterium]|nr:hypothetical protein [Bacteroidota bacterium]MBS1539421.1 hypothetical protein [Bacteroidota bacterium]